MLSFPKDTAQLKWTRHIKNKMIFYHLSGATVLGIFRRPERTEEGVAPQTNAAMRSKKAVGANKVRSEEIWIMYQIKPGKKITLISTWRYPGVTKPGARIEIPADALAELAKLQ